MQNPGTSKPVYLGIFEGPFTPPVSAMAWNGWSSSSSMKINVLHNLGGPPQWYQAIELSCAQQQLILHLRFRIDKEGFKESVSDGASLQNSVSYGTWTIVFICTEEEGCWLISGVWEWCSERCYLGKGWVNQLNTTYRMKVLQKMSGQYSKSGISTHTPNKSTYIDSDQPIWSSTSHASKREKHL